MFNPHAKHRQEKFVKFFTILVALMNRIRRRVKSASVLDFWRVARLHAPQCYGGRAPRAQPVGASPTGFRRWTLDVGRWTLDVGRWTLDVGRWTLDVGCWTLDVGCWTLDVGCWIFRYSVPLP